MSTAVDNSRRRPNLWSYISFGSTPRRRSVSLPTKSDDDPFEKANRHANGHTYSSSPSATAYNDGWMASSPRSRIVRTVGIIAFVAFIFFLLAPGERQRVGDFVGGHRSSSTEGSTEGSNGAAKCSKSHSSDKPLIQYALMIDAGSTGSRIHVYRFNNCGPTPELEFEEFKQTEKKEGGSGLSSYKDDSEGAAKSLDVLMDAAMKNVPDNMKGCSPIAVKATAGLRMLGEAQANKTLEAVRHRLETVYPFPVVSRAKRGIEVMDGADEGVYAWITTNYLLGKIGSSEEIPTAAVFDLGGGSTQIVFQPYYKKVANKGMPETLAEGDHKYKLDFGGRKFDLYQHSHLGFGLMAARKEIHKLIVEGKRANNAESRAWMMEPIENPCIAPKMSRKVEVELDGKVTEFTMVGPSTNSAAQCRGLAEKLLKKDKECKLSPCSFGGVYQPSLPRTFAKEDVYILSFFYDRMQPLGMPESFTLREMQDLTAKVCGGSSSWGSFEVVEGAMEELNDRPEYCLDLSFMLALLHTGYEMPIDREVKIAKQLLGRELGWALGASLPLLSHESGWECRARQVQ